MEDPASATRSWTLLTSHGRILLLIAQQPDRLIRELAQLAGVTERSAQAIVADLERAGYVEKERIGRRNQYRLRSEMPFRHPAEAGHTIGELIGLFVDEADPAD